MIFKLSKFFYLLNAVSLFQMYGCDDLDSDSSMVHPAFSQMSQVAIAARIPQCSFDEHGRPNAGDPNQAAMFHLLNSEIIDVNKLNDKNSLIASQGSSVCTQSMTTDAMAVKPEVIDIKQDSIDAANIGNREESTMMRSADDVKSDTDVESNGQTGLKVDTARPSLNAVIKNLVSARTAAIAKSTDETEEGPPTLVPVDSCISNISPGITEAPVLSPTCSQTSDACSLPSTATVGSWQRRPSTPRSQHGGEKRSDGIISGHSVGHKTPDQRRYAATPTIPSIQTLVPSDRFGSVYSNYDYTLPDRGLGMGTPSVVTGMVPAHSVPPSLAGSMLSPRTVSSVSPNLMNMGTPHWAYPGKQVARVLSQNSVDCAASSAPLDLSGTPRGVVIKHEKQSPSPCVSNVEESKEPGRSKKDDSAVKSKVPYEKNMLIFGERELEIISVGPNKWVVRNESEILRLVRQSDHPNSCNKDATGCGHHGVGSVHNVINTHVNTVSACCHCPHNYRPDHSPADEAEMSHQYDGHSRNKKCLDNVTKTGLGVCHQQASQMNDFAGEGRSPKKRPSSELAESKQDQKRSRITNGQAIVYPSLVNGYSPIMREAHPSFYFNSVPQNLPAMQTVETLMQNSPDAETGNIRKELVHGETSGGGKGGQRCPMLQNMLKPTASR